MLLKKKIKNKKRLPQRPLFILDVSNDVRRIYGHCLLLYSPNSIHGREKPCTNKTGEYGLPQLFLIKRVG